MVARGRRNLPRLRQERRPTHGFLRFARMAQVRAAWLKARGRQAGSTTPQVGRTPDRHGEGAAAACPHDDQGGPRRSICWPARRTRGQAMLKEFRDFAMRGNVVDLAMAVMIGAAFGKIVDSLVNDIVMPIIGIVRAAPTSPTTSAAVARGHRHQPRRCEEAGRRVRLWQFRHRHHQFPHRRVGAVSCRQGRSTR